MLTFSTRLVIALLVGAVIFTNAAHARPPATDKLRDYRSIGWCIEAGRDDGQTDEEITERCIPSGDSLSDYE